MFRLLLVSCLVGLSVATPALVKTKEQIEEFRQFLENTQTNNGNLFSRIEDPNHNPEEGDKFQGDILLDRFQIEEMVNQFAVGYNSYNRPETKWPENTVVWEFGEGEFEPVQMAAIRAGIEDIEKNTCVRFRERQPEDTAFVRVTGASGGCFAHVGYSLQRGVHTLNLARNTPGVGCFRHPTIVHEWMHILGFLHMHSTYNRNNYVKIMLENLMPGTEHNFDIFGPEDVTNHDVEYDYVSCLHYGPNAFSSNGEKTIVALQEHEGNMGQREFITDKDWLRINRHYNCPGAWDEKH